MQLGHIKWDKRGKPILPKGWKVVTADGLPKDQGWITAQGEKILVETGLGGEGAKDRLEFKDLWAMHTEGTATILYLLRENTIKGFIVVGTLPITGTLLDIPHIWVYAVDNETRGRGAGAYLLHQALRLPNVVKAAFVSAHVYRANATSRAALEKAAKGADRRNVCIGHVSLEASSQDITWDSRGEAVEERDDNKLRQLILQRKGKNIWQHKPQPTTKPKPKKTPKKRGRKGKKPLMGAALRSQSQRAAAGAGHKQKTGTKTR